MGYLGLQVSVFRYSPRSSYLWALCHMHTQSISGRVIDEMLCNYFLKQLEPEWTTTLKRINPRFPGRSDIHQTEEYKWLCNEISKAVVKMKKLISSAPQTSQMIEMVQGRGESMKRVTLTASEFEHLFYGYLQEHDDPVATTAQLAVISACEYLEQHKKTPLNIQRVYVIGGPSKLKLFRSHLIRSFGNGFYLCTIVFICLFLSRSTVHRISPTR